jgi:L-aminopeptidase/D-esterase-like protein
MQGLRIGHYTQEIHGTGVSVFLFDRPAVAAYHLCASSPATHELGTLELDANVTHINGLALMGGSAFGLTAVEGVMRWLQEQGQGWAMPHGTVPIVPAAAIYDLAIKSDKAPTADNAYDACRFAVEDDLQAGRIGAGAGASVGKVVPDTARMTGGVGRAQVTLANGATVLVYAVVNCVGDVLDEHADIIAGAKLPDGEFANCAQWLLADNVEKRAMSSNTTLVAVFTDAKFSRVELKRIAKMASAGMGRAISPAFTRYEGDIIFCVSLEGHFEMSELVAGTAAALLTQQAIINAVKDATIL